MPYASPYHQTEKQLKEEQAWVEDSKRDPRKFEVLYNKYHEQIFRFIYQRLDDKNMVDDLTSQVFLKAMLNIEKYQFRGVPFASWLYRIAQSELSAAFRAEKVQRTVNIETENLHGLVEDMEDSPTVFDLYQGSLIKAISMLQEDDLQLIELRYFEQRSYREIGDMLDITENNAKVKTFRVVQKLKKQVVKNSKAS